MCPGSIRWRDEAWPALGPRDCQVVWTRPALPPADLLDDGVRMRLTTLRHAEDRARHATGATLADALVRAHGGPGTRIVRRLGEAPEVHGVVGLHTSVTHGGEWVAVAVTALAPVGVDIERRDRDLRPLVAQVLAPLERAVLAAAPDRRSALLTYWTRKEAILKATGDGLRTDLRTITVAGPTEYPALLTYAGRPELTDACVLLDVAPDSDHVGALAVLAPEPMTLTSVIR
jgi:4'-phosphopantetheinyl transferase